MSQSWFRSANCDARYGAALSATVAVIVALSATGEWGRQALRYERTGLADHQWWRLLSAHLVHLSWEHALLNSAGLSLLWFLFARDFSPRRWLWIVALSVATIDAGLWFLRPQVNWYLGASGVLHGVLAAGACAMYRRGEGMGAVLLLLLVVKLIYEQQSGSSLFAGALPLVPDAHLFGTLGGLTASFVPRPPVART
ncbi:MAG TPA: rhombosortase [Steroidobacteraceae bacterium]|jgi:rhomboid family GlyGly-CTERM serine protease|nr:rhombosortase [Steroidobacteraceae bacterium]